MIRSVSVLRGAALALIVLWAVPAAQAEDAKAPYRMVRTLQALQGEVAQGNSHAHTAQRALLLQMDELFATAPAETWSDPRNARAAVIHLLSGGHPRVMRQLLDLDPQPDLDPALMRGALAYVEGRQEEARDLLTAIDPMDLPPNLGGQVALVRAALAVGDDPEAAMKMLGVARLLMPGTLVEEAALRREVFVAGKIGDIERFQSLSIRYLRRFRGSIYEGDFRRRFALALETLGFGENDAKFALLESLLAEFDSDSRRMLYLRLARQALVGGHLEIVRKATERALPLAMAGTSEHRLLRIYRAGALLDPRDIGEARDLLWSIDRGELTPEERELMDAVYAVLNRVRHWPEPPPGTIGEFGAFADIGAPKAPDWRRPTMAAADRILTETGALLQQSGGSAR